MGNWAVPGDTRPLPIKDERRVRRSPRLSGLATSECTSTSAAFNRPGRCRWSNRLWPLLLQSHRLIASVRVAESGRRRGRVGEKGHTRRPPGARRSGAQAAGRARRRVRSQTQTGLNRERVSCRRPKSKHGEIHLARRGVKGEIVDETLASLPAPVCGLYDIDTY